MLIMAPIATGLIVFACVFGAALLGIALRTALPEHHLSPDSKSVVTMGMGVVGTMAALVLGLLVASAQGSYETQRNELTELSAKVILLDQILAHYGPETKTTRDLLRSAVAAALEQKWPNERLPSSPPVQAAASTAALYQSILELSPKDDPQRTLKIQAVNLALELGRTRWLMYEQGSNSISTPLVVVVVFWLAIIFMSFGLFAPANSTVVATLFVCALSVSGAVFLILELYQPFTGLIHLSSTPLRNALAHLGQ